MRVSIKHSISILFVILSLSINAQEIISPNKKVKVVLNFSEKNAVHHLYYKVLYKIENKFVEVLPDSKLGINRTDEQFVDNLDLVATSKSISVKDKYEMVCGKRHKCENLGTQKTFSFQNSNHQPLDIVFRVYNDGIAFRYVFPNQSDSKV
ncbi:MAG: glycoside hydrolase family 97 N-terminal domain-containing protein, partial [Flavobacterium sp.]